ncbi:MAG: rRNA pseudouridine synthase [Planctomycetales bacterium]|nr:rRNA pseudouridine synthase [Planctomycetales bacterium]
MPAKKKMDRKSAKPTGPKSAGVSGRPRAQAPRPSVANRSDARDKAEGERLQKLLASAGLGSRRECEELITTGRVEVNRQVVSELGARANPTADEIRVDGEPLRLGRRVTYMLNKPPGVVCTNNDPSGRARAVDLIDSRDRLFTIGRLDRSSEGLILVTNDGELANRLTHPRYGVAKTYRVEVAGHPTPEELRPLREGVRLAEGVVKVEGLKIRRRFGKSTELELVLTEGLNREIRRMLAKVGHKVLRLTRVAIGRLMLGELPTGAYRELSGKDLQLISDDGTRGTRTKRSAPKRNRAASRPGGGAGHSRLAKASGTRSTDGKDSAKRKRPAGKGDSAVSRGKSTKQQRRVGAVISYDDESQVAANEPNANQSANTGGKTHRPRRPLGQQARRKGKRQS